MTSFLNHELKIKSYTVLVTQRLAQGGFGYVDLAIDVRSRREVVLKRCSIQRQESFATVNKEIRILQQFKGPYVVELIAEDIITLNGKQEAVLLLELCPGGHLLQRLIECSNTKSYFSRNESYKIFGQICSSVKSLHDNTPPITHRDLKLENILFGSDGNVRLCDFGSCVVGYIPLTNVSERTSAEEIISKETTQMYRAPELIDLYMRNILTEKTDIWALGCIFYAINFLKHPFQDLGGLGILSCNITFPNDPPVSEESKILIKRMLDVDPEARPSVGQIIDAITALLRNEPLPHYELSEEAIKKRQERLDREAHKAAKRDQKKKGKEIIIPKRNAHLDSNSVAARRLAAAKGLPVNSENFNHKNDSNDSNLLGSIDENVFTDFGSFNINETNHAVPQQQQQQQQHQVFDGFDAFGNNDTFSNQSSNDFPSFDAFANSSTIENFSSFTDSQFVPSSSSASSSNTFDLFQDDVQPPFSPTSLFGNFPNDTAAGPVSSTTSSPRGSFTQLPTPSNNTSPRNSYTSTVNEDFLEFQTNPPSALPNLFGTVVSNDNNKSAFATPRNSFTSTQSLTPTRVGSHEIDLLGDIAPSLTPTRGSHEIDLLGNSAPVTVVNSSIDFLNDETKIHHNHQQSSAAAAVLSLFDTTNDNNTTAVLRPSNISTPNNNSNNNNFTNKVMMMMNDAPPNPFKDMKLNSTNSSQNQYKMNKPIDPFAELSFIQKR